MTRTTNYRILNPVTATTREVAEVLNRTVDGKLNSVGEFTLPAGGANVTVTDPRVGKESVILFEPHSTNYYNHEPFIVSKDNGSFVVGQKNNGHSTPVEYVVIG